jgi:hypothetical protein
MVRSLRLRSSSLVGLSIGRARVAAAFLSPSYGFSHCRCCTWCGAYVNRDGAESSPRPRAQASQRPSRTERLPVRLQLRMRARGPRRSSGCCSLSSPPLPARGLLGGSRASWSGHRCPAGGAHRRGVRLPPPGSNTPLTPPRKLFRGLRRSRSVVGFPVSVRWTGRATSRGRTRWSLLMQRAKDCNGSRLAP